MLGCQQWNGEPEAGLGSRCMKSKVLSDLERRQRNETETKRFQNCFETVLLKLLFQPKQNGKTAVKRLTVLANHNRYPLFMQNCCL